MRAKSKGFLAHLTNTICILNKVDKDKCWIIHEWVWSIIKWKVKIKYYLVRNKNKIYS